ncbi:hypothetical protein SAMN04488057_101386 [Cyclobacterium lianum]|uniref:SnoaL-like domain-containing protein n=1 Tax=Cyclobacterium lianum TaxID=388280 RepID=A0A1M7IM96_9BACT|nr:hypothetical protein [Cyclobacterium lianum]SHM41723.1 hypothetical protein SAMN04488057_101386 [Cyclobacterium lianum]
MTTVKSCLLAFFLLQTLYAFSQAGNKADAGRMAELDAFWNEVSRTVAEGDFEGYAHTFHKEATLVSGISGVAYPIAKALSGWKRDFDTTKSGERKSSVAFRFNRRLGDSTTAYESGIFHYSFEVNGEKQGYYIHFDGLLVKEGTWKMMMEYQKSPATKDEWEALK